MAGIAPLQFLQFLMVTLYFFAPFVLRARTYQGHFDQIFLLRVGMGGEQIPFQGFQRVIAQLLITGAAFAVVTMLQKSIKQFPIQPFFIRRCAGAERMQGVGFLGKPWLQNIQNGVGRGGDRHGGSFSGTVENGTAWREQHGRCRCWKIRGSRLGNPSVAVEYLPMERHNFSFSPSRRIWTSSVAACNSGAIVEKAWSISARNCSGLCLILLRGASCHFS